jgi:glycosyltransferase involved in cell wall biosynthesis
VGVLGGAERVLLDAVRALKEERPGLALKVLTMTPGPLLAEAQDAGAEAELIEMPRALAELGDSSAGNRGVGFARQLAQVASSPEVYRFHDQLRRCARAFLPDLVHSNGLKTHLLAPSVSPRHVPIVWHLHDFVSQRPVMRRGLLAVRGQAALGLAISRAVAEDFQSALGDLPVQVLHNAVDCNRFSPGPGDGAALDALAGLSPSPAGTVRVGLVATYARWKGHEVFLRAAARVAARAPRLPVRFYVVGGPIYRTPDSQYSRDELVGLANGLGLHERVGFIPFQADTVPIYRALDVAVHASTSPEPFGLTIVEAMACGRPVVVSLAGGARELVHPGEDALAAAPQDVRALSEAMERLAGDAAIRERLGTAARRTALQRFSRERWGARLLEAYARAVSSAHR